jgi:hypothetical protein
LSNGFDLFVLHEGVTGAAREMYRAEVVVPHTRYVGSMVSVDGAGRRTTESQPFRHSWKVVAQAEINGVDFLWEQQNRSERDFYFRFDSRLVFFRPRY